MYEISDTIGSLSGCLLKILEYHAKSDSFKEHAFVAQGYAKKLWLHSTTLMLIIDGARVQMDNNEFIVYDSLGARIIARSCLENLSAFRFVFFQDPNLVELRYRAVVLSGLLARQSVSTSNTQNHNKLVDEKKQIKSIRKEIRSLKEFKQLTEKLQEKVLQGEWKVDPKIGTKKGLTIKQLLETFALSDENFSRLYSMLSDSVHSSGLSIFQANYSNFTGAEGSDMVKHSTGLTCVCLSKFISLFCEYMGSDIDPFFSKDEVFLIKTQKDLLTRLYPQK